MTKTTAQWVSIVSAVCVALAAQLPLLKDLLSPSAVTVILVLTNIVSAVLPSVKGEAQAPDVDKQ